ncbi:hypothetical protein BGW38_010011, partial [Lunasporangiospora selenospora]
TLFAMKITYVALAAVAFAQMCIAGSVLPCTGEQDRLCRKFQREGNDMYYCICTSPDLSCQVGMPDCNSDKKRECKDFCDAKVICGGSPCPYPSHCTKLAMGGKPEYKCTQYSNA